MQFYIETERLILRDVQEQDVDGMFELDSNTIVHQHLGKKPIKTKQQAVEIIKFIKQQYKELGIGRFATIEKASGEFIGWSGLKLNVGEKEELNNKRTSTILVTDLCLIIGIKVMQQNRQKRHSISDLNN